MGLHSLRKEFRVAVAAGEQALRIDTDEIDDALRTIYEVCDRFGWEMRVWDPTVGTVWHNLEPKTKAAVSGGGDGGPAGLSNQGAPSLLQEMLRFNLEPAVPDEASEEKGEVRPIVYVFKNFHLAFERDRSAVSSVIQHIVSDKVNAHPKFAELNKKVYAPHGIEETSDTGKFIVGLMPQEAALPTELRPLFKVITHDLPDEEELGKILEGIIPDDDPELVLPADVHKQVCKFALGLTRLQAEGVFAACLVEFGERGTFVKDLPPAVWRRKSEILNKEGLVALYTGPETFKDVVGQDGLKALLKDLLKADEWDPDNPDLRSKGVALVGPPRTGKSLTCKAVGNELGLPVLNVDLGSWFGGIVGDTERNTRKGFQIIRAHAPCIAVIDEVEKVMPSAKGGDHDSGVSKRMAGTFMTQLQDIKESVFWAFTANGVEDLHEAFLADDRVDCVVYVHMPGPEQLAAGWRMYLQRSLPLTIDGKPFSLGLNQDFEEVRVEYQASKKKEKGQNWENRFMAALLCVPRGEERDAKIEELEAVDDDLAARFRDNMIDDSNWTIARIKAVCRLSRKRRKPLAYIAGMMPRNQRKLRKVINSLEKWAADEAIDAETGQAYEPPPEETADETEQTPAAGRVHRGSGKVRRRVRSVKGGE